ncbi:MAG: hypothetical protein C0456_02865 [Hyphomonas sp.]|nr:hypothetical protein [Hyphomonas sp.]
MRITPVQKNGQGADRGLLDNERRKFIGTLGRLHYLRRGRHQGGMIACAAFLLRGPRIMACLVGRGGFMLVAVGLGAGVTRDGWSG